MRTLILLLVLISCQNQGSQPLSTKSAVINGEKVTEAEENDLFFSSAAIQGGRCSGILISRNVVLTAAHCINEYTQNSSVFFGTNSLQGDALQVEKVIVHPGHVGVNSDLAILILSDHVIDGKIKPMKILDGVEFAKVGEPVLFAGYSPYSKPLQNDIFEHFSENISQNYERSNLDPDTYNQTS